MTPTPQAALEYLENLCRRMDRGLRVRPPAGRWWCGGRCVPIGLSLCLVTACAPTETHPRTAPTRAYEVCDDGIDNDANGRVDCDDTYACRCAPIHADNNPSAGPERNCHDGLDDDGDGLVDCYDEDCSGFCAGAEYAAPAPIAGIERSCVDGLDDDGDGAVDCDDVDCRSFCGGAEYAAPMPEAMESDCSDGVDNDGDGAVDRADPDCQQAVALYSAPMD